MGGKKSGRTRNAKRKDVSAVSHAVKASHRQQFGALPWRLNEAGAVEVLLVTSRTTKRWIIPKGWPMGDRPPHKVAAQEAFEEAGVEGRAVKRSVGAYDYMKMLSSGANVLCRVDVFALEVQSVRVTWPERKHRERRWLGLEEAAALISDAGLAPILRAFMPPAAGKKDRKRETPPPDRPASAPENA